LKDEWELTRQMKRTENIFEKRRGYVQIMIPEEAY
jgi:hypothetical protein